MRDIRNLDPDAQPPWWAASDQLTGPDIQVLETAMRRGYFASPPQCTVEDIADEVGRSHSDVAAVLDRFEQRMGEALDDEVAENHREQASDD